MEKKQWYIQTLQPWLNRLKHLKQVWYTYVGLKKGFSFNWLIKFYVSIMDFGVFYARMPI